MLPDREALVGYQEARYVRIDPDDGSIHAIGELSGGFTSSGDLVSEQGGGTYLTVSRPGCDAFDCLVQVDPSSGDIVRNWAGLGYRQVYGLAAWGGKAYGFSNRGVLLAIEFGSDEIRTAPILISGAPPSLSFWGAGSSTRVPLDPIEAGSAPVDPQKGSE